MGTIPMLAKRCWSAGPPADVFWAYIGSKQPARRPHNANRTAPRVATRTAPRIANRRAPEGDGTAPRAANRTAPRAGRRMTVGRGSGHHIHDPLRDDDDLFRAF